MKKLLLIAVLLIAGYQVAQYAGFLSDGNERSSFSIEQPGSTEQPGDSGSATGISQAFAERRSNIQVEGEGRVAKILKDDNDGSRHQRFIVRLDSGQTVLIAHNIDLAPRVDGLREGDAVSFYGEYEWNDKGGVIHWTHADPQGRHPAGWIRHDGRTYQ
jgi:Protein of unknown function (DUF3465)